MMAIKVGWWLLETAKREKRWHCWLTDQDHYVRGYANRAGEESALRAAIAQAMKHNRYMPATPIINAWRATKGKPTIAAL